MKYSMENLPKTDSEGFEFVLEHTSKTDLARGLDVSKQLISRWKVVPIQYVVKVSEMTHLPISSIRPELERSVSELLNRPSELLLPQLIRLLAPPRGQQNGTA